MDRDLVAYTAALAVVMPPLVAFVVQTRWRKRTKRMLAFVLCLAAGLGVVFTSSVVVGDALICVPATIVSTQVVYHVFWKPTRLLPWLEQTTNVAALRKRLQTGLTPGKTERRSAQG